MSYTPPGGGGSAVYAKRASMLHNEALIVTGTGLASVHDALQDLGVYAAFGVSSGAPANGDVFSHSFMLRAGTYTFYAKGITNSNSGKLDWAFDGAAAAITGQDWYSAGTTYNVVKSGSITIATDGYHYLTGTINGKNGSSSDYFARLTNYWIVPASD